MLARGGEWMTDLLDLHCEELAWLWRGRLSAWRSAEYDAPALAQLDERIAAHTDALVLAGADALPQLHHCIDEADEPPAALGGAYALLMQEDREIVRRALAAFQDSQRSAFAGFRFALRYAPPDRYEEALRQLAAGPAEPHAAAALAALAFHGRLRSAERLLDLVQSSRPEIRCAGWDIASLLDVAPDTSPWVESLRRRLAGPMRSALSDTALRPAAMLAAAWTCQDWLPGWLRKEAAATGDLEVYRLLAVLGTPQDLSLFQALARDARQGAERWLVLGSFGHPEVVELLLQAMESEEPRTAARAAQAFRRMTRLDVDTPRRLEVVCAAQDEDGDAEAITEEIRLPDAARARAGWERLSHELAGATRLCWGTDANLDIPPERMRDLPLDARWERALRSRFASGRGEGLASLECLGPHDRRSHSIVP